MYPVARTGIQWVLVLTLGLACGLRPPVLQAQKKVSSESTTRPELGDVPASVLKVENLKGTLKKVDLEKRTVTVAYGDGEKVFAFPTAAGKEKITAGKKVARMLGKKALRLEEVPAGSQVKVAYYPALGTIMEITVEEVAR